MYLVNDETQNHPGPEVVTLPYRLSHQFSEDTDEATQVLILGSYQNPLARFVPLNTRMIIKPINLSLQVKIISERSIIHCIAIYAEEGSFIRKHSVDKNI